MLGVKIMVLSCSFSSVKRCMLICIKFSAKVIKDFMLMQISTSTSKPIKITHSNSPYFNGSSKLENLNFLNSLDGREIMDRHKINFQLNVSFIKCQVKVFIIIIYLFSSLKINTFASRLNISKYTYEYIMIKDGLVFLKFTLNL